MWSFETEPEFQEKLDWMMRFVKAECEPLDYLFPGHGAPYDVSNERQNRVIRPLQQQVKEQGLWACHLDSHLGGKGYGQLKLALMNEILGRSYWAPTIFGTAAPDTGNAEILAMFGTEAQKAKYLQPLLDGEIVSTFSMTEPHAGSDPAEFTCHARRDGEVWVIEGEKWFSSNSRYASFLLVLAVTDPEAPIQDRLSMFIVPSEAPGLETVRDVGLMGDHLRDDDGMHGYLRYNQVRIPLDHLLGEPGGGFRVAQARLGGGRVHHAMRTVGKCQRALDMMLERAVSRRTKGKLLSEHQFVQGMIADSIIELEQFRLLVLKTAWIIDTKPHGAARTLIAMCKVQMAKIYHDIVQRAIQIHGSLGVTNETPLAVMWQGLPNMALADGPTEVHKVQVAKAFLRNAKPAPGPFPSEHILPRLDAARARYADLLGPEAVA